MVPRRPLLLLLTPLLAACPPRGPMNFGVDGEPSSAEEVLQRVAVAEAAVTSVRGDAKLYVDSPQGKGSVSLFAAVAQPALVHIEQLDFFNRPQGMLVTDGERFGLFDVKESRYYRGPASPTNLGRFLPLVLPPAELAAVMLGRAPRITPEASEWRVDEALGVFVVTLKRGPVTQVLHVQPPSYRVVKSVVEGMQAYDLDFSDIETYGAATLPEKVKLSAPQAQTSVELSWKDVTVGVAPDAAMFDQEPPEGVEVVEVDEAGRPVPVR